MRHRLILALGAILLAGKAQAADMMRMAVTTSFHNSGLSDVLLPAIREDLGLEVQLLVVGTGQALKLGQAGDVDAILVHSRAAEEAFVAEGHGTHRREIMYNDFVLIGPDDDPAGLSQAADVLQGLRRIAGAEATFVSRGDLSGTHNRELDLWAAADLEPEGFGRWYNAVGAGMGAALNTASGMGAYILSDRASWLNFGNKGNLVMLHSGDPFLFNQYAYLPVNPDRHRHVKHDLALRLEHWMTGERARDLINGHMIDGQMLFVFNATDPG